MIAPLAFLFAKGVTAGRPFLYLLQLGLMGMYLLVELLLDYILQIDFRQSRPMVIAYITLFFAGTGGMVGAGSHAGRGWSVPVIISFLLMAALTFVQHFVTGE